MLASLDQKLPSLISATATMVCEVASRIRVARAGDGGHGVDLESNGAEVVVWPGAPAWAAKLDGGGNGRQLVADQTVRECRRQVARAALEYVSRSSAA